MAKAPTSDTAKTSPNKAPVAKPKTTKLDGGLVRVDR